VDSCAAFEIDGLFTGGPGVVAGGQSGEPESSALVRHDEMRGRQHQDKPAHVFMDIAAKRNQAGHVEDLGRDRLLIRAIAAEIEALGGRVGKDVVIGVFLQVRKFDFRSDLDGQQSRDKGEIFLRDLLCWKALGLRKRTIEIDHGERGICREDATSRDHLVAFGDDRRGPRLGQVDATFNGCL
jgi:hypothetical protein